MLGVENVSAFCMLMSDGYPEYAHTRVISPAIIPAFVGSLFLIFFRCSVLLLESVSMCFVSFLYESIFRVLVGSPKDGFSFTATPCSLLSLNSSSHSGSCGFTRYPAASYFKLFPIYRIVCLLSLARVYAHMVLVLPKYSGFLLILSFEVLSSQKIGFLHRSK